MPTIDQLSEEFSTLTDEELIDRLRSGTLTEMATDAVRRELAARGVDLRQALAQPPEAFASRRRVSGFAVRTVLGTLARVLRFPLRALLGVEPLWAVVVSGAAVLYLLSKLMAYGFGQFVGAAPIPPYVLPLGYVATGLTALVTAWFAAALWRSAPRAKSGFWKIAVRLLAVLVGLYAVNGILVRTSVMQQYFGSPPASVMDSVSK